MSVSFQGFEMVPSHLINHTKSNRRRRISPSVAQPANLCQATGRTRSLEGSSFLQSCLITLIRFGRLQSALKTRDVNDHREMKRLLCQFFLHAGWSSSSLSLCVCLIKTRIQTLICMWQNTNLISKDESHLSVGRNHTAAKF